VEALITDSSASPLRIVVRADHDTVTVALGGEFDLNAAPQFSSCADEVVAHGIANVVIDLAGLTFIDSSGIAALVDLHRLLNASGRRLRVVNVGVQPAGVFDLTGLRETLTDDDQ
jgi:anti-sigma B factor antagonist/stage II sporulation protein AA (anti-sigma F factor antagonist)